VLSSGKPKETPEEGETMSATSVAENDADAVALPTFKVA